MKLGSVTRSWTGHRLVGPLAIGLAGILVVASARTSRADVIVLDACVKPCTAEDLQPVEELRHIASGRHDLGELISDSKAVAEHLGDRVPRSTVEDPPPKASALIDELKDGIKKWANSDYNAAVVTLREALALARNNPELVLSDPTLRQLIDRAEIGLAVSLSRQKRDAEARKAIADLVRTTPTPSVSELWGGEVDRIFQPARTDLLALGKGSLVVQVDDPTTIFYINETGDPHKTLFASEMFAGPYQVVVKDTEERGRRYHVDVTPGTRATVTVNWKRDSAFFVTKNRVGFTFSSDAERKQESEYARYIASMKHERVTVVSRIRWRGGWGLVGTTYSAESNKALRVGVVSLGGDSHASIEDLVAFLFSPGSPRTPRVVELAAPPWEVADPGDDDRLGIQYPIAWGISGGLVVGGAIGLAVSNMDPDRKRNGYVLGAAGIVGAAITTILYWRGRHSTTVEVAPTASGMSASVGWSF